MNIGKKIPLFLLPLFAFFSFKLGTHYPTVTSNVTESVRLPSNSEFIAPLLTCASHDALSSAEVKLRKEINQYIEEKVSSGKIEKASVQYYDFKRSTGFSVNEKETYQPASLLKTAFLMAILRKTSTYPNLLNKKAAYHSKVTKALTFIPAHVRDVVPRYAPKSQIEENKLYSIKDLAFAMVAHSDNRALFALNEFFGWNPQYNAMKDLKIKPTHSEGQSGFTISNFSEIFQVLYNATYISQDASKMALDMLSKSSFNLGLRAGVPLPIPIAHKFAERSFENSKDNSNELHDCGIVYYPQNPYLLCVMTKGNSWEALETTIAETSQKVFAETPNLFATPAG